MELGKRGDRSSSRIRTALLAGAMAACGVAWGLLTRIESGRLFLIALPGEAAALDHELADAEVSARTWRTPAVLSVAVCGGVLILLAPRLRTARPPASLLWRMSLVFLLLGALADLTTTLRFFHLHGVDREVHPGIRLFGYAFGRTAGPVLAKLLQVVGLLLVCRLFPRAAVPLAIIAGGICWGAAVINLWPELASGLL